MLRLGAAVLSPLRTRFDEVRLQSPRTAAPVTTPMYASFDQAVESEPAEDYARDARIELMRRATEELKGLGEGEERLQLLTDVQRIMSEEPSTKAVFRELDGFLVLMNILSGLRPNASGDGDKSTTPHSHNDTIRRIFGVFSQATQGSAEDRSSFQNMVGYDVLHQTLETLVVGEPTATPHTLGCLLGFAMHDFDFVGLYEDLSLSSALDITYVDGRINAFEQHFTALRNPEAIVCLMKLLHTASAVLVHATLKILERIVWRGHLNQALLNQCGLCGFLFEFRHTKEHSATDTALILKILRRLMDMGCPLEEARVMFKAVLEPGVPRTLDATGLEQLKASMRAAGKWPNFVSFGAGSVAKDVLELENAYLSGRAFPGHTGFTYLAWVYVEHLPSESSDLLLLRAETKNPPRSLCELRILPSGYVSYFTSSIREPLLFEPLPPASPVIGGKPINLAFPFRRWAHVALVHHASRSPSNVRLFIDGTTYAVASSPYPKGSPPPVSFSIGNDIAYTRPSSVSSPRSASRISSFFPSAQSPSDSRPALTVPHANGDAAHTESKHGPIWFMASAHLLLQALPNDLARLIYTLGNRYTGNFQDTLTRFLTYKASTSLNITISQKVTSASDGVSVLTKALRNGLGVKESYIAFALSPNASEDDPDIPGTRMIFNAVRDRQAHEIARTVGDVNIVMLNGLDNAVWEFGGAPVLLRLVEVATSEHELVNSLSLLADGVNANWQNSEDMERMQGYTALVAILRTKVHLITAEVFNVLMEMLGLDIGNPENSTITNPIAYRVIALDFAFWSLLSPPLQRLHLHHFQTILQISKFRNFNARFRFSKFGTAKKILFVIQTNIYKDEMMPEVISALECIARQTFSTDATIKPIVSYLAANLEPNESSHMQHNISPATPVSVVVEKSSNQERAEQVLEAFVNILASESHMKKFKSALPAPRVCLLLLGTHPTSVAAAQVLNLVGMMLEKEPGFTRKFDLVSFWQVLRDVLPPAWDPSVHVAIFDVLLGRSSSTGSPLLSKAPIVSCPAVFPAILTSLQHGLSEVLTAIDNNDMLSPTTPTAATMSPSSSADSYTEVLAEELIELHSSSPTFRRLFHSPSTTEIYVKAARGFIVKTSTSDHLRARTVRISEKLTHLTLMLALDTNVDQKQKEELLEIMRISQDEALTDIPLSDQAPLANLARSLSLRGTLRLDITHTVDRSLHKVLDRTSTWRQLIVAAEKRRMRKAHQDQREYLRQMQRPEEWHEQLHSDHGLWPEKKELTLWRLDETEGPMRIRKKLQPELSKHHVESDMRTQRVQEIAASDPETQSVNQTEVPPWEETYEYGTVNLEDDKRWAEEATSEDKNRRVRHELEPSDVIEDVKTVTRIVGVDASPGLFIVGRTHIYMLDGLVQDAEGEIIDARDAPKDVLSVPGTLLEIDGRQYAQRWAIDQVAAFSKRTYLFRDVGLEVYFKDSRSILIVFANIKARQTIMARLHIIKLQGLGDMTPVQGTMKTPLFHRVSTKISIAFQGGDELLTAQRRWQTREISNYTYISLINQASGRTPNDLTQYPVFPWVLSDYTSEQLDLSSPKSYRDLTMPIGALTEAKREAAELRYLNLQQVDEVPFHYGTHFSSSMIVSHFMIRLSPFSHYFKVLQGGDWDLPDRLFTDIKRAWDSASSDSRGDVRELIPEFFTCPEFLENLSKLDFGVQTSSERRIDNVELPPWAKQDPRLFIDLHRRALESDFVSENLPHWIDLIWGYKQRDQDAVNVYHPLSYEGAIDLDSITDDLEREAKAGIIHNFGQTPHRLFTQPHPQRYMEGRTTLPLGMPYGLPEDNHLLLQSPKPVKGVGAPVTHMAIDPISDRVLASQPFFRCCAQNPSESVQWGFPDKSLRLCSDSKLSQVVEAASVICCEFVDNEYLVTAMEDSTVCVWSLMHHDGPKLQISSVMRGHTKPATAIAASRSWSLVVTGSPDSLAILWDLNRGRYVRAITHSEVVTCVAIQEASGYIATCSQDYLQVYTINAQLIVSLQLSGNADIRSLAFHEREWCPVPVLAAGTSDGAIHLRTWNADNTPPRERARWEFSALRVLKARRENEGVPSIDALKFAGESLYHGDNFGNVYSWTLPDQ